MKVNWKEVAKSPGYKSMKAAVANEANRTNKYGRKPDERYEKAFRFAISRAKHYAVKRGVTLDVILNEWEKKRDYNFISFYSDYNLPKLHSNCLKPIGINGYRKRQKSGWYLSHKTKFSKHSVCREIMGRHSVRVKNEGKKVGKKARWTSDRKARIKRIRELRYL